jgi:hypothetical protein
MQRVGSRSLAPALPARHGACGARSARQTVQPWCIAKNEGSKKPLGLPSLSGVGFARGGELAGPSGRAVSVNVGGNETVPQVRDSAKEESRAQMRTVSQLRVVAWDRPHP